MFTRDVTLSSSSLVNRYFDIYDPPLRDYLQRVREGGGADRLLKLIDKVQDMHVVLVGDTIIDEYQYVSALGKSSKENIVATLFRNREQFAGGVIAAANHVASFCKSVEIVTDARRRRFIPRLSSGRTSGRTSSSPPIRIQGRPTTRKLRFVEMGYLHKLFEVYTMNDTPLEETEREQIDRITAERVRPADVVIVTDFGHGMIASSTDRYADRELEIPGGQRAEQQRQSRLQPDLEISACGLHLHRRPGSPPRRDGQDSAISPR